MLTLKTTMGGRHAKTMERRRLAVACLCVLAAAQCSPMTEEVTRLVGTAELRLSGDSWDFLVESLAHQLAIPVLTFAPPRWSPGQRAGAATDVLRWLEAQTGGEWHCYAGALALLPDPTPLTAPRQAEDRLARFEDRRPLVRFVCRLGKERELLATFARGGWVAIAELPDDVRALLSDYAAEDPDSPVKAVMGLWHTHGQSLEITWTVQPAAVMFYRGTVPGSPQDVRREDLYGLYRRQLKPDWDTLARNASAMEERQVVVSPAGGLSIDQMARLVGAPDRPVLIGSRQLARETVYATAGVWPVRTLLVLAQAVSMSEIRRLRPVLFIGPSPLRRRLGQVSPLILRNEVSWQCYGRVLPELLANPQSMTLGKGRVPASLLLDPRLMGYGRLPPSLRAFAKEEVFPTPPTAEAERDPAVECWFYPTFRCHFRAPGDPRGGGVWRGFAPMFDYDWLSFRTLHARGQDGTAAEG